MELLSPAGNYKGLIGCVNAGADAVYLGGERFGARAYADNFSDDEIVRAVSYAHLHGVKIYLTVNTLIKEREFKDVISYIRKFYEAGLDACIVQDLGLISVFTTEFPGLELHVSTQGFSLGVNSVSFYKDLGASRVVLARELSLKEISNIKRTCDIELETFIHGSLCYGYSGECLFSSCMGGRSGNRGRCAGPCRLSYSFNEKEAYLLSMKDQCTVSILPKLIDAGIDSLKIEGRMKSPEYTAFVTSVYRRYIDLYKKNPSSFRIKQEDMDSLKSVYLRSEISEGYYFRKNGRDMITLDKPSYLSSDEDLFAKIKEDYLSAEKQYVISAYVYIHKDELSLLTLYDEEGNTVSVNGQMVLAALNKPLDENSIIKQISKSGDSLFAIKDITVDTDNASFITISALNELRRLGISEFEKTLFENPDKKKRLYSKKNRVRETVEFNKKPIAMVTSQFQINALKEFDFDGMLAIPLELYNSSNGNVLLNLPYILRDTDYDYKNRIISVLQSDNISGVIINNYEEFSLIEESGYRGFVICGPGLYVFNSEAKKLIYSYADSFVYPYELSKHEIKEIQANGEYLVIYGKIPLMHSANCVINTLKGCKKGQGEWFSYIKDRKGMSIPVKRNCELCYNTLYNSVPTCLFNENVYDDFSHVLMFTDENYDEVISIMDSYKKHSNTLSNYTKAYFSKGVE